MPHENQMRKNINNKDILLKTRLVLTHRSLIRFSEEYYNMKDIRSSVSNIFGVKVSLNISEAYLEPSQT